MARSSFKVGQGCSRETAEANETSVNVLHLVQLLESYLRVTFIKQNHKEMFKAMSATKFYFRSTKNCLRIHTLTVTSNSPKRALENSSYFNTKQPYQHGFFLFLIFGVAERRMLTDSHKTNPIV